MYDLSELKSREAPGETTDTFGMRMAYALALVLLAGCAQPSTEAPPSSPAATRAVTPPARTAPSLDAVGPPALPCRQQDIRAEVENWGAAAGSLGGTFGLSSTSNEECALPERPAFSLIDATGNEILSFESPATHVTWALVRPATRGEATRVVIVWSGHGGEPSYRCSRWTAPAVALHIQLPSWYVALEIPEARRVMYCAQPAERVFVSVTAH